MLILDTLQGFPLHGHIQMSVSTADDVTNHRCCHACLMILFTCRLRLELVLAGPEHLLLTFLSMFYAFHAYLGYALLLYPFTPEQQAALPAVLSLFSWSLFMPIQ